MENQNCIEYNKLPRIEEAHEYLRKEPSELSVFGEYMGDSGLYQHADASLVHRHFALNKNERLVNTVSENSMVSEPKEIDDSLCIPFAWAWREGKWQPYEFLDVELSCNNVVSEAQALERHLLRLNFDTGKNFERVMSSFGITVRANTIFRTHKNNIVPLEVSNEKNRRSVTELRDMNFYEADTVGSSSWSVNKLGDSNVTVSCSKHCVSCQW